VPRLLALSLMILGTCLGGTVALAQETSGAIGGRIRDEATGAPLAGLTVVAQGPQGEEAALTDEQGDYLMQGLPPGSYLVKVYAVGSTTAVERPDVVVSAGKTIRLHVRMPAAQAATPTSVQTYVIERRAPVLDLGSARTGTTFKTADLQNLPVGTSYGEVVDRAPGAFTDRSGSVSVAGASGLENVYNLDGLNVTGIEYGDIMNGRPNASGGSNLPLLFVEELSISTGGYGAEHGGAMGGVINVVTRSGSNRYRASAYSSLAPGRLAAESARVARSQSALVGRTEARYDLELGVEAGGPLVRDRLFFWAGFAPRREGTDFVREVQAQLDADGDGVSDLASDGQLATQLVDSRSSDQWRRSYPFGFKLTFLPRPEHRVNLALFSTPFSSVQAFDRTQGDAEAAADPRWALQEIHKRNSDLSLSWTGQMFERRWILDATVGVHDERYREGSPWGELNDINQIEWHGTSLFEREGIAACQPVMRAAGPWDPCPLDLYRGGGFGHLRRYSAQRWAGDLTSTHLISAGGNHELKYGARVELSVFDQTRRYTGPPGIRALVQQFPGNTSVLSFFSLPPGRYPFQFADGAPGDLDPAMNGSPAELAQPPMYRDELAARVKNLAPALFVQDAYSPLPNLTIHVGARLEQQRLYDHQGQVFADLRNLSPRGGVLYDVTGEGRSKLFAHYGRFYEAVPLNLAARYFGGEGILVRNYDNTACGSAPASWQGQGEWRSCPLQPQSPPASSPYAFFNNGSNYPVQPHLRGQYHDELVAGAHYQLARGPVLGLEYTHRWLGAVIEDGTATDFTFVLANPGNVSPEALDAARRELEDKRRAVASAPPSEQPALEAEVGALQSKLDNLEGLAAAPKPERTYDAITLSAQHRFGRRFSAQAFYTYSRLYGNYNGLYDADNNYFAPNGGNSYDTPDLVLNRKGRLANDRPHAARLNGFYDHPLGDGSLVLGIYVSAYSGVPRNHVAALIPGQQLVFLLPRGSAGRTPAVTQTDVRVAYRHKLSELTTVEASLDLFNVMNRRTALRMDDNYTFDMAAAIVDGTPSDLPHARNIAGVPVTPNPNFGRPTAYQAPLHGQVTLQASF
jgi:hypothetical protein